MKFVCRQVWGVFLEGCSPSKKTTLSQELNFKFGFMWHLYLIEKNKHLYSGITTDLSNRLIQHGKVKLIYTENHNTKEKAAKREKQIKGWSKQKKLTLLKPNLNM